MVHQTGDKTRGGGGGHKGHDALTHCFSMGGCCRVYVVETINFKVQQDAGGNDILDEPDAVPGVKQLEWDGVTLG